MSYKIDRVAVIGAGTMGGGIASLIAGTGIPVLLLDVPSTGLDRNATVKTLWERQRKSSPALLFSPEGAHLITLGNTEDNFDQLRECDWIIEVILEQLAPKQQLMDRIEQVRKPNAIVSSNTSGIPIGQISAQCSMDFKRHFLGTHFFNPPRYLKLLEIIPTPDTLPDVTAFMQDFGTRQLGKGVVICKDTPGFIANRIGVLVGQVRMLAAIERDMGLEEVDAITGPLIGQPRTATFRLADLIGLDVLLHLTHNQYAALPNDEQRAALNAPAILQQLYDNKALGNKTGAGFYKTVQTENGKVHMALNLRTGQYEMPTPPSSALDSIIKEMDDVATRYRAIFAQPHNKHAQYLIDTTLAILSYVANRIPEISDSYIDIDNAMKWGFNWSLGPFEIWDAIGVAQGRALMRARGLNVPQWVEGVERFYERAEDGGRETGKMQSPVSRPPSSVLTLSTLAPLHHNPSASIFDLGDGVLCLEFHGKGNTLDADVYAMGNTALALLERDQYRAMVIGSQGKDFCLGANIRVFLEAGDRDVQTREGTVRDLQEWLMRVRCSRKPIVTAPYGRALGGGAEVVMAGAQIVAAPDCRIGLVEVGVGLIPAGGGCKELLRRVVSPVAMQQGDVISALRHIFRTILQAMLSDNAIAARELGFIAASDTILTPEENSLEAAKRIAIQLADGGYSPPRREDKSIYATGAQGQAQLQQEMAALTGHDVVIANHLAQVLCGGNHAQPQWVSEDALLQRERQAFAALLAEPNTQARIRAVLERKR